jgi:branched-chain amino acid transport system permease protein
MKKFVLRIDLLLLLITFSLIAYFLSFETLSRILCAATFALSFQFLFSRLGLLSFGHAAFWGLGSYTMAILFRDSQLSLFYIFTLVVLVSALAGLVIGFLSVKSEGIYFSMITLALAQILYFVALKNPITRGEDGIPLAQIFEIKKINNNFTLIICVFFIFVYLILKFFSRTRWNLILMSLKDNPLRSESLGFFSFKHKLMAFMCAAVIAGVSGALKSLHTGVASLSDLHWHLSGEVVL